MRMHTWLTICAKERPTLICAKLTEARVNLHALFGSTKPTNFAPTKQNSDPANDYDCPLIISARRLHTWLTVRVYVPLGAKQSWPKQKVRRCGFLQIYQTFFSLAEICCHICLYNQWVRVKKCTKVFTPCVAQQSWRSSRLPSRLVTLIAPWSSPHQDNEMVDCTTYSVCATQADQSKRSDVAAPHSLRSYTHKHYWPGGEQGVGLNEMWTP